MVLSHKQMYTTGMFVHREKGVLLFCIRCFDVPHKDMIYLPSAVALERRYLD